MRKFKMLACRIKTLAISRKKILFPSLMIFLFCFQLESAFAKVFFEEDFEGGGLNTTPNPVWSWKEALSASNLDSSMAFGSQDMYSISGTQSYTGNSALQLNFEGRNNICNQCGTQEVILDQTAVDSSCVAITGAPWSNVIYNKTNGFSSWSITSFTDTQVCFNKVTPVGKSLLTTSSVNVGDSVLVPFQCDVNGIVGNNINRRSDCNKTINYLDGVVAADFPYGKQLARRFYLYIPSTTELPGTTLKLGYAHFRVNGKLLANTVKLSVQRGVTLEMTLPGGKFVDSYAIAKDKWYYFEEVWTRESADGAADGKYQFWVSPADKFDPQPHVTQTAVDIGELANISVNGNFQHNNDAKGSVYFDSVVIADGFIGPINSNIPDAPLGFMVK